MLFANWVAALHLLAEKGVGNVVAQQEENEASHHGEQDVGRCGEVGAGTEHEGVLICKGRQGRVAAAEPGCDCQAQVGGGNEPTHGQPAEKPHEQAAQKIDGEGVPGHARHGDIPFVADIPTRQVAQDAAYKAATAYAQERFERKTHVVM